MKIATFDSETNGLLPDVSKVWCICILDHAHPEEVLSYGPEEIPQALNKLSEYDVLCGHNIIDFDFAVFRLLYGWHYHGRVIDTLLISRVQRPNRVAPPTVKGSSPHSIEAWGSRLGHSKVVNEEWEVFTPNILYRCQEDVRIQHELFFALAKEGSGEGWKPAHRLNSEVFQKLRLQRERGWKVDIDHMNFCIHMLNKWIGKIDSVVVPRLPVLVLPHTLNGDKRPTVKSPIKKSGGLKATYVSLPFEVHGPFSFVQIRPVDMNKPAEVKDYLLSVGWKPKEWNRDSKGNRTSPKLSINDPFEGLDDKVGGFVAKRVQCRQRRGVVVGWKKQIRGDGRIETPVNGIAATGRLRHSVVVNVPGNDTFFGKWQRAIFTASEGMVMIGCDSKGNQVRQLCARMGDDEYTKAVLEGDKSKGTDEHSVLKDKINKMVGYTLIQTRTILKNCFYGTTFGAQGPRIAATANTDLETGTKIRDMILSALPKLSDLIESLTLEWEATAVNKFDKKIGRVTRMNGYITGLDGRPVLVPYKHEVLVYLLQSDEAIQMAYAYNWFWNEMEKAGYQHGVSWGMLIWYHDEFQFEIDPSVIPIEFATKLAEESIKVAGEHFNIQCEHEGEAKVGYNWCDCH